MLLRFVARFPLFFMRLKCVHSFLYIINYLKKYYILLLYRMAAAPKNNNLQYDGEYHAACIELEDTQYIIDELDRQLQKGSIWRNANMYAFKNPYSARWYYGQKAKKLQEKIKWMEVSN